MQRTTPHAASADVQRQHHPHAVPIPEADVVRVPEPMQRTLHYAQIIGKEPSQTVSLTQRGFFRMRPDRRWRGNKTMLVQQRPDPPSSQEHHLEAIERETPLALPAGSIYSDEEVRILGPGQQLRQRVFGPVVLVLSRLGISANHLSYASVLFSLGFCLLAPFQYTLAFWLLVTSVVCDGLDGVLARLTHTNTPRGSFTDLMCDVTVVALSTAGLAWKGLIHPALAVLFVFAYTALALLLVLHRLLRVSSVGIVRPSRMIFFAAITLDFFWQINLLHPLLLLYLFAFPLLTLSFWKVRKMM